MRNRPHLVENFAGQWLHLRDLEEIRPDSSVFRDADKNLRDSLRRQTELLFEAVLKENRSIYDLLTANFTFVNERLARHYGIPNIYGDHFRRITLSDSDVRGSCSILPLISGRTETCSAGPISPAAFTEKLMLV